MRLHILGQNKFLLLKKQCSHRYYLFVVLTKIDYEYKYHSYRIVLELSNDVTLVWQWCGIFLLMLFRWVNNVTNRTNVCVCLVQKVHVKCFLDTLPKRFHSYRTKFMNCSPFFPYLDAFFVKCSLHTFVIVCCMRSQAYTYPVNGLFSYAE